MLRVRFIVEENRNGGTNRLPEVGKFWKAVRSPSIVEEKGR